jgi:translocation protein SEC72
LPDAVADPTFDAQTQAAFSSNPAQEFDEENDFRSGRAGDVPSQYSHDRDEDYALLQQSEADDLGAPHHAMQGAYDPTAPNPGSVMHDYDTSYGGAYGQHYSEPSGTYGDPDYHPGGYGR